MENGAIDGGARKKGRTARKNITVIQFRVQKSVDTSDYSAILRSERTQCDRPIEYGNGPIYP